MSKKAEQVNESETEIQQESAAAAPAVVTEKPAEAEEIEKEVALVGSLVDERSPMATILNADMYNQLKVVAKHFAESQLIPAHFRGKKHDVFIALHMAHRLGCDPILVLQNLYIVNGNPGWRSQFIIAQANMSGIFRGRIKFKIDRSDPNNLSVMAYATMKDGEEVDAVVDMKMATLEKWTNNAKYKSMPEHMLCFRAATFLVRRYAPEVMLGVPVVDEIEDMSAAAGVGATINDAAATKSAAEILRTIKPTAEAPTTPAATDKSPARHDEWLAEGDKAEQQLNRVAGEREPGSDD